MMNKRIRLFPFWRMLLLLAGCSKRTDVLTSDGFPVQAELITHLRVPVGRVVTLEDA